MSALVKATLGGGQIAYEIEGTAEEVRKAIEAIEANYHPLGYGTSFWPMQPKGDDRYVAYGSRSNSCD